MNNNKETLSSICVEKIRELILNCELLPGEKIKGSYLKNYLGVGLSPIREALSRLSAIGIVELIDNIGFRVSQLSDESVLDFYVSYAMIEQLLFIESIKNHNDVWEANVVATLYQLAKLENLTNKVFYSKWSESNEKFHDALVSGACLNELMQIYKNLVIKKKWYHNLAYGVSNDTLITLNHREHSKIAELALVGDYDTAPKLLHKHTMNSCDMLLANLAKRNIGK